MITDRKEDSLMIGKIRKGRSFGGCIRYVTQKDDAEIIASEGVLLGTAEEMARSFRWQCLLNPDVAKPVGHIALSFKPEDAPRLTDAFMARLAGEYLELMGIRNTQFIVVRHHGSDSNDFKRNERVTKMLKDKYSLTYSEGKQSVKTEKLHVSERVKYEIYRAVKEALRSANTWKEFQNKLLKMGVEMEFKYKGNTNEVQGIRFIKDNQSFKGSEIDRSFSWSRLDAALDHNHVTSLENDVSQKQPYHEQSHGSVIDNLVEVTGTGGVFMPSVVPTEDEKEAERLRRKKKRRKGRSL
ncbi:relaxase/mobilization nuclease domain-containing protein [Bacteroides eggerthii]|nr:relaxase/mobilization nuclease domain-containing protein [Bacteroides eggerthii]